MSTTGLEPTTTYSVNEHSTIWANWPSDWAILRVLMCAVLLTLCSCQVTYALQSETILFICLNVNELLAQNRCDVWSLSDCKETRTHNHLICKRTLNNLAKFVKRLRSFVNTYLYGAFACMFLLCHVRISEWIHTLYLSEYQGTPCSLQARYLKFKWLQRDSNLQPLIS